MQLKNLVLKYSLQNAVKFGGKATPNAVLGKVLSENPDLKKEIASINKEIEQAIKDVNRLSLAEQEAQLRNIAPELLEKREAKEKDIFEFLKVTGKVTTAFPPEPSKYPHIGHAKAMILNHELARKYNGTFVLRFEDTNPKLAKKEFYNIHLDNYKWLGLKWDRLDYASDYMDEYSKYAEKLIKEEKAYICSCEKEKIRENRFRGIACKCRDNSMKDNLNGFQKMFSAKEESLVLRIKIDLEHKNTTMRDPAIMRIIDHPHPRLGTKYRVWPNYDFENAIMDGMEKITHRLRSKEFEMRSELQRHIQELLGFKVTQTYEFARFNLEGVESSGRIIREKIQKKELVGWDDPSLTTLVALRRRGFLPEAIKNFVLSTGISKAESTLTWDDLIMQNKRLLDKVCNRYFFVEDPVEIKIDNAPDQEVRLKLHPEFPERGFRVFRTKDRFLITKADFEELKEGKLTRLMDCLNFTKKDKKFAFDSVEYEKYKSKGGRIIHWLSADKSSVEVEVMMPDKNIKKGLAEKYISELKVGDEIQFERFGFCRLDAIDKTKYKFWYSHK